MSNTSSWQPATYFWCQYHNKNNKTENKTGLLKQIYAPVLCIWKIKKAIWKNTETITFIAGGH